ncbi:hypothetical protein PENPOL_c023G06965 [Penicillium polonicum]|uniref:Uncharacterized protein n=1 Tax=Penicillium polonicum TaxID=60169 RepID=A0A1V6N6Z2_PENPO|nr:hypothetical protein PENPOL_c023G06965 [Penicillium polonicum]
MLFRVYQRYSLLGICTAIFVGCVALVRNFFQLTLQRNPGEFYITFIQTIEMDAVMWMHIRQYFRSRHRRNHELASRHGGLGLARQNVRFAGHHAGLGFRQRIREFASRLINQIRSLQLPARMLQTIFLNTTSAMSLSQFRGVAKRHRHRTHYVLNTI